MRAAEAQRAALEELLHRRDASVLALLDEARAEAGRLDARRRQVHLATLAFQDEVEQAREAKRGGLLILGPQKLWLALLSSAWLGTAFAVSSPRVALLAGAVALGVAFGAGLRRD